MSMTMPRSSFDRRQLIAVGIGTVALGALSSLQRAGAAVRLEITPGSFQPMPIAIPDFLAGSPQQDPAAGRSVSQIITANLQRSGLFAPIDQAAFIEKITSAD